jgi:site-specific DNA recombinase
MKRAVLYARVSGDDRHTEGRNLEGQLDMCRQYAQDRGWQVVAELAEDDRGASGAAMNLPQLSRVFEMAENGKFDVLVARELDRLSRRLPKQLFIEDHLKQHDVAIEYVLGDYDDSAEGILMKNVRAVLAEYERLKISERSVRGRRQKVKAGNVIVHGRPPYGYRKVKENGTTSLAIVEEEARVVRLAYQWYTLGDGRNGPMSMYAITKTLSERQIPTRGDKRAKVAKKQHYGQWNKATVSGILRSETYCGVWHYGKKNGDGWNPDSNLIAVEVPAIVDRETWEAAQRRRAKNTAMSKRNTKYQYLLSRRALCGTCGAKMHATGRQNVTQGPTLYYHCPVPSTPMQYAKECDQSTYFRADQVEPAVWEWVKQLIGDPDTVAEGLRERDKWREEANQPIRDRLDVVEEALTDANRQMDRLLDLYLSGEFTKDVLTRRHGELEQRIRELEREQAELQQQLEEDAITDDQVETLKSVARKVADGLDKADEHFETRRKIVDLLDVRVTLAIEDGEKVIEAECRIGEGSVAIASATTTSSSP